MQINYYAVFLFIDVLQFLVMLVRTCAAQVWNWLTMVELAFCALVHLEHGTFTCRKCCWSSSIIRNLLFTAAFSCNSLFSSFLPTADMFGCDNCANVSAAVCSPVDTLAANGACSLDNECNPNEWVVSRATTTDIHLRTLWAREELDARAPESMNKWVSDVEWSRERQRCTSTTHSLNPLSTCSSLPGHWFPRRVYSSCCTFSAFPLNWEYMK